MRTRSLTLILVAVSLLAMTTLPTLSSFSGVTGNASTFASATSFCQAYTPVWMTGMEAGAVVASSGNGYFDTMSATGSSSIAADNTVSHSGAYSLRVTKASGGDGYIRIPYL